METILVLPLYLMLLGGMFVIGELILGRYFAHDVDRALAWRAADRFGPTPFVKQMFDSATVSDNGILSEIRMVARTHKSRFWGNDWLVAFGGRADVTVGTPWWTALINVQRRLIGKDDDFDETFKLNSSKSNSSQAEFLDEPRVWVCRRRRRENAKPHYTGGREAAAGNLNWSAIAYDTFPGATTSVGSAPEAESVQNYKRCPLAILASGDY